MSICLKLDNFRIKRSANEFIFSKAGSLKFPSTTLIQNDVFQTYQNKSITEVIKVQLLQRRIQNLFKYLR